MATRLERRRALAFVVLSALVLSACGGTPSANKSGASVLKPVTLRLEMPDLADALGRYFAKDVATRSEGSVKIQVDTGYSSCVAANELKLAQALEAGRADIGYLPARAWAAAGLPAFKALLAPFAVTTEAAAQRLASAPVAQEVLKTLPSSVVGLALVPAEPRRVLAVRPPATVGAFAGLRIRIVDDPQSAADFQALGAHPVQGLDCHQVFTQLRDHKLDAVESEPNSVLNNGYFGIAHYLSAYGVFPKFQSIVVAGRVWDRLSAGQRSALRAAAVDTVAAAARQLPGKETEDLAQLCLARVEIVAPSMAQLQAIAAAAQPAVRGLTDSRSAARVLAAIRRLPGAGPQRLASALPSACRVSTPVVKRPRRKQSTIPNGVYRVTDTVADWAQGGVDGPDFNKDTTFVTTFRDGRWYQTQQPNYPDQGPFSGTYTVHGDQVVFIMLKAGVHGQNSVTAPETVRWSYFDGKLRFKLVQVADTGSRVLYIAHPWVKIR